MGASTVVRMSRPDQLLLIVVVYLLGAAIGAAHRAAVGSPPLLAVAGVLPWPVAAATVAVAPLPTWGTA